MADLYTSYAALAAGQTEGVDYLRTSVAVTGATWASIAIHGGAIEAGSGEMARAVGVGLMNHCEFAGIMASNNFDTLHITSTLFDEPNAVAMVLASRRTLSFHGYLGITGVAETAIGGLDSALVARVTTALTAAGFAVTTAPSEIAGTNPANICNKNASSAGVQLEMSNALRASFFPGGDTSRTMRDSGQRTPAFNAYAAAVRSAYDGQGKVSQTSINVSRFTTVPAVSADVDIVATMATDALAVGGAHFLNLTGRYADASNCYLVRVAFNTDQTITLTLRKRVAGTETLLATAADTSSLTHAAGTRFGARFQITGSTLRAKIWLASVGEPSAWAVTTTDTALTAAGAVGTRSILSTTNTNTLPVVASYENFAQQVGPQVFNVTRSVNGIVKAQGAGTAVSLADPSYTAL